MREFIRKKINLIFNDFKLDLDRIGTFCELKDLRFNGNHTPDYSNDIIQRLYLLRYFPAYLTEYYLMYVDMFEKDFLDEDLNIISIGAGCGIDFWSCKFAIENLGEQVNIRYTGIDIIDWNYWDELDELECYLLNNDINEMESLDEEGYNVIVFPKSIGELDNNTFLNLKRVIGNTNFTCDKIMILSSVRTTRAFIDVPRLAEIVTIFETRFGYSCLDDKEQYTYYEPASNLEEVCPEFIYPFTIKEYINNLMCKCEGLQENWNSPHYDNCSVMDRYPITTTSQIKYQVVRLER